MIASAAPLNRPAYSFKDPVDLAVLAQRDSLLGDLVATRAFQRLKSIRFLGGIDYLFVRVPNGARGNTRYSRYQHSLGVTRLAVTYCDQRSIRQADRNVITAAALLHDVGHGPFSHSLEPIFEEYFGINHHQAAKAIITGKVPLGKEVHQVLRQHQVDVEQVLDVLFGDTHDFDSFFSGPINFDTIEGILRSQSYARPNQNIPSPEAVTEAALKRDSDRDRSLVDEFWLYKDRVYRHIINSHLGVLADFACQYFMRGNLSKITIRDYFVSESAFFQKLPGLRDLLTSRSFEITIMRRLREPIHFRARRFFIDPSVDFFARNDRQRYCQSKEERILIPKELHLIDMLESKQDLFYNESN
jgi:hypothetical protein